MRVGVVRVPSGLQQVAAGRVDVALALGVEKLTHPDKAVSFQAFGAAVESSWCVR